MLAPAGKAASPVAAAWGVVRWELEHPTLAAPQEVCGAGGGELAAERQVRGSFSYSCGKGWAPGLPSRAARWPAVEVRSCNAKLCPRVFAESLPQLWGWVNSATIALVAQVGLLGCSGC